MTAAASTAPARAGRREWAALAVLTLAVLLIAVDGTVLSLAVPALAADLRPSATGLLWIGDVYSFVLAGLLVTMGTLGDRIGRKRLLLAGAAGFALASALAAYAPGTGWLIAARALQGVAGATLMPSTLSLIRATFADPRQRTLAVGIWSAAAAAGAAIGPLVGGVLLAHFWWGSARPPGPARPPGRVAAAGEPAAVLTEELVAEVFGIRATVAPDPVSGRPLVLPISTRHVRPELLTST